MSVRKLMFIVMLFMMVPFAQATLFDDFELGSKISDFTCGAGQLVISFTYPFFTCQDISQVNGNLNMTNGNITDVKAIYFQTENCVTDEATEGKVCWNSDDKTLNVFSGLGNVLQVGQEVTYTVKNLAGRTVYNGEILTITGATGERPSAVLANSSNDELIHEIGMVTVPSCNNNADCQITTFGLVRDVATDAFSEGDSLYLSEFGNITGTRIDFPNYNIHVGTVLRSHASTGIIIFYPEIDWGNGVTVNRLGSRTNITALGQYNLNNVSIKQLPSNGNIDGSVIGIMMTNPPNQELPHFILQSGGSSQASVILRSLMIANEVNNFHNTTDRTDCVAYMTNIGEVLKIDCNTTTTGADLLVSDDMQVVGDVWIKDADGEWHFITRTLSTMDQLQKNTVDAMVNGSLSNNLLTITDHELKSIVTIIGENVTITGRTNFTIVLTNGTNATPQFNHIYFSNPTTPTLTKALSAVDDVPDVAQILVGDNYQYAGISGASSSEDFIRNVYHRFYDNGVLYLSGFNINATTSVINITSGTMKVILDDYTTTSNQSTANFYTINSTGNFDIFTSINSIAYYSSGEAIGNTKYFNMVCGIVTTITNEGRMLCIPSNKPATEYSTLPTAEQDNFDSTLYFPSQSFVKKVFLPVVRVVIQRQSGTNTIQTLSNGKLYFDVRGTVTNTAGSTPSAGVTDHGNLDGLTDDDHLQYLLRTDYATYNASLHDDFVDVTGDSMTGKLTITEATDNSSLVLDCTFAAPTNYCLTADSEITAYSTAQFTQGTTYVVSRLAGGKSSLASNYFYRDLAATDTAAPLALFKNDNAGDDQNAVNIQQDANATALSIDQNGNGNAILVETAGSSTLDGISINANAGQTTGDVMKIYTNSITTGNLIELQNNNAAGTGALLNVINAGTGNGVLIDQNGNGIALNIDNEGTGQSIYVDHSGDQQVVGINNHGIWQTALFTRDTATPSGDNVKITEDSSSSAQNNLVLQNDGTGNGLFIDQNGEGTSLAIDSEQTTGIVLNIEPDTLTSGTGFVLDTASAVFNGTTYGGLMQVKVDNPGATGTGLFVRTDSSTGRGAEIETNTAAATGDTLFIDNNGNGYSIYVDSEATSSAGIYVDMPGATYTGLLTDGTVNGSVGNFNNVSVQKVLLPNSLIKDDANYVIFRTGNDAAYYGIQAQNAQINGNIIGGGNQIYSFSNINGSAFYDDGVLLKPDTNESTRFNNLVDNDCPTSYYAVGVNITGGIVCLPNQDVTGYNNIMNQSLNTTSDVRFKSINVTSNITISALSCIYFNNSNCAGMCMNATGCVFLMACDGSKVGVGGGC